MVTDPICHCSSEDLICCGEASNWAIVLWVFLYLPCENRKAIPDINYVGMFFGSLIIPLIALVRSCMTESRFIQEFFNFVKPRIFPVVSLLIILSTVKCVHESGVTC